MTNCCSDTCAVGTVTVEISHTASLVDEVVAVDVIHDTVAIVIFACNAVLLLIVYPDIVFQVRVLGIYSCINNSYHWAFGGHKRFVPNRWQTDSCRSPLLAIEWFLVVLIAVDIATNIGRESINNIVWLSKFHFLKGLQLLYHLVHAAHFARVTHWRSHLWVEANKIHFAQIMILHLSTIVCTHAAWCFASTHLWHEFFYFFYAKFRKKCIHLADTGSLELAFGILAHLYCAVSFELNDHFAFAIGVLIHTINLNNFILVVIALCHQRETVRQAQK